MNLAPVLAASFVACMVAIPAYAQSQGTDKGTDKGIDIGKYEYETYCALCHGKTGTGDGPFSMLVNKKVPDLTTLAKNNGGVFPFARAYDIVEGKIELPGHGTREMPIWGDHYNAQAPQWLGPYYQKVDEESFVRGRILALIGYISTLQAK